MGPGPGEDRPGGGQEADGVAEGLGCQGAGEVLTRKKFGSFFLANFFFGLLFLSPSSRQTE